MLNRIRRAASLTRARYFRRGRHRRPLMPHRLPAVPARTTSVGETATRGPAQSAPNHRHLLRGEDVALVRPYVLAWEKRTRRHELVVAPHLQAEAWSALVGVH